MAHTGNQFYPEPGAESAVMHAWESLLRGARRVPAQGLRKMVDTSWQRCRDARVDPHSHQGPLPVTGDELARRRERRRALIRASESVMADARNFLSETGTLMVLADSDCTILDAQGDAKAIGAAESIHLMPGVSWSEMLCGTNAIGTALEVGAPVQVHSAEHYCAGIKRWTCSAAVIRHPADHRIIGVLDLSGLSWTYSRYSLALVVAGANSIENRLRLMDAETRERLIHQATGKIAANRQGTVVLFDRYGCPVNMHEGTRRALLRAGCELTCRGADLIPELAVERLGLHPSQAVLPPWLRAEWIEPVLLNGEHAGTLLMLPQGASCLRSSSLRVQSDAEYRQDWAGLLSADPAMLQLMARAQAIGNGRAPVLLHGETGVGKELFARGLHTCGPFVAINCGGLPRDLLASELFGYGDGAFTGARKGGVPGKIEAASGGTLFLDEIGEMPLEMQAHLLRVLEQKELYRVGETTPRKVNFRLIAATHRDLRQEAQAGRFRLDLFYRIAVFILHIPPLRSRDGDIPLLARHFWNRFCSEIDLPLPGIEDAAMQALMSYSWPGNVRELRNVLESAALLSGGRALTCDMLPSEILRACETVLEPACRHNIVSMEQGERLLIQQAITACNGNLTMAARQLGIAKSTLYVKMTRYGISRNAS